MTNTKQDKNLAKTGSFKTDEFCKKICGYPTYCGNQICLHYPKLIENFRNSEDNY